MLKLHSVNRGKNGKGNRYCGPAAISILTGITTDEAARVIRHVGGRTIVKASSNWEVLKVLRMFGIENETVNIDGTRGQVIDIARREGTYLIVYKHHFAVVGNGKYCCGQVKKVLCVESSPELDYKRLHAPVRKVYKLWGDVDTNVAEKAPAKKAPRTTKTERNLMALAHQMGFEVDRMDGDSMIYVNTGSAFSYFPEEADPFDDDHYVDDWSEVRGRLLTYLREMKGHPTLEKALTTGVIRV